MVASPEPDETSLCPTWPERRRGKRARRELLAETVYRPLAAALVRVLLPLGVSPAAVVLANAAAGLGAAVAIARGELVAAALLLQVKTVLDNADGQLARASGRTTALGRYLDTEADLLVNVLVFAALAGAASAPVLAVVALLALTVVLSADFNEDALHRRARGEAVVTEPSAANEGVVARVLARVYGLVFSPQDRVLQAISASRLNRLLSGVTDPEQRARVTLTYHDRATSVILANCGLSTQLAVLGACLALGEPVVYLWLVVGCAALLPLLQLRRELAAGRALKPTRKRREA